MYDYGVYQALHNRKGKRLRLIASRKFNGILNNSTLWHALPGAIRFEINIVNSGAGFAYKRCELPRGNSKEGEKS
jgi:hypothetical protein